METTSQRTDWNSDHPVHSTTHLFLNAFNPLGVAAFGGGNAQAGLSAVATFYKAAFAWQREYADFAGKRLDKSADLIRRLMDADSTRERVQVQGDYVREFFGDYLEGAQRLINCTAETSREVFEPIEQHAEAAADEVDRRTSRAITKRDAVNT
jgi:Phasin protein